ncbi:SIR2 family protein [Microbacterium lacticum]|uniref:SIR2 family protein n=1 Tax=Microbacterium lacticum TaxID=33885 RepID=UPI001F561D5E|nr:SIR2 family protein [Microbacterium lacticum]
MATSMHSQPGVYAVLLGSGVSTGAGLLTGWGVVTELVARVAAASAPDDAGAVAAARADPELWWSENGEGELGYSSLLEQLAPSAAARQGLLAGFFEPGSDDETPVRQPSMAHRAIAELVRRGSVKVIVTTNFDRLMEQALDAAGVSPQVISRPEAVNGMAPLAHSSATVIKLHGDYRDLGTRNTPAELSEYPVEWTGLLEQVFDEYGLIVSGWSADWDVALVGALEQSTSRRYPLYWDQRSSRGESAKRLLAGRGGIVLPASNADDLFGELVESLEALDRLSAPPLTTAMAVARLKRYLPDPVRRIDLHDLVMGVVDGVVDAIAAQPVSSVDGGEVTWQMVDDAIDSHVRSMDQLAPLLIEGVWHDSDGVHDRLWVDVVQRLVDAGAAFPTQFNQVLRSVRLIPALVAVAVISITATRRNREGLLLTVATEVEGQSHPGFEQRVNAAQLVHYQRLFTDDWAKNLPRWAGSGWLYPTSHLFTTEVRRFFRDLIPDEEDFLAAYRGFEYRLGLIQEFTPGNRAMSGEYVGETGWRGEEPQAESALRKQAERGHAAPWDSLLDGKITLDDALIAHRAVIKRYQRWG